MDTENVTLLSQNGKLQQEIGDLKLMLSLVKENLDLRARVQEADSGIMEELTRSKTTSQWQDTLEESKFNKDLQQTSSNSVHKTSSPVNFESFIKGSMHTDTRLKPGFKALDQSSMSWRGEDPERLVGEIAFQLDRRILFHVFQGQTRLYGFTVLNIQEKIIQVTTHPLTGRTDEGYRLQLSQRYADLMESLVLLGYSATLHPPFTEFIINTYGIMKSRSGSRAVQDYNDPDLLRKVIVNTAPPKLLKDLLLLLSCLSFLARKDGKPLFPR